MYVRKPLPPTAFLISALFFMAGLSAAAEVSSPLQHTATLAGHAILPADTFISPPADAPNAFQLSGRFTQKEADLTGITFIPHGKEERPARKPLRPGKISLPFAGQPLQGFSGIKQLANNHFLILTDNGFGSKQNSTDALLMFHHIHLDWQANSSQVLQTFFLHDPDHIIPFRLVNEETEKRYLTGADLDPEGIQPAGELIWFSDEFGPYLFASDKEGRVVSFFETVINSEKVTSPDHHLYSRAQPAKSPLQVRRSRGFEGLAASYDNKLLYPLLEGALWNTETGELENDYGRQFLRIIEFDIERQHYTGRYWKYLLEHNGNSIGDFNMISKTRGLVIERDNGEGAPQKKCTNSSISDCFQSPALFKRIYLIELPKESGKPVRKVAYLDLLNILDPHDKAVCGSRKGVFTFPFITVENVDRVDGTHIIVVNDNNLPFSSGREIGSPDNSEFILLHVGEMFNTL